MLQKYPRPFFNRQVNRPPATAGSEATKITQTPEEEKAGEKTASQDFHATGLLPPPRLARAYVIWQKYGPIFNPSEALEKGTVFPDLYSPYTY